MVRSRKPPSQTGNTFLNNHTWTLVSVDFFTLPTIRFEILYVFRVLAHERLRIVHFAATKHLTAEWTVQQLREAFRLDTAPRYLLRNRDRIFGQDFVQQVKFMGIKQVLSAPRSPWRTHLSLGKDAPRGRPVQSPEEGDVVEIPEVGGLNHHYERRAA